jgi:hypothetical protein
MTITMWSMLMAIGDNRVTTVEITISKIISVLIALGYIAANIIHFGVTRVVVAIAIALLVPLALIWFPDEIGTFTGYVGRGGYINQETPPILITIMGWFFLVGMPVILYFIWR